mmetsp:Transcript_7621/g.25948  ORF Transcript_7621/g.25948 Transcript_7621/m.25948 type:complete len:312 (-) Transcript_7621:136-1071(-)
MFLCTLDTLAAVMFACEIFLATGCGVVVLLVPSLVGGLCTALLLACGVLGALAAHTANDTVALFRVLLALVLSAVVMFFVVPRVEELANALIDDYLLPRADGDPAGPSARELRRTLHFGEDALLCVFVAMVCSGWILFSSVFWTHVRRGRMAERALRRFMKATPAVPYLSEPLLVDLEGSPRGDESGAGPSTLSVRDLARPAGPVSIPRPGTPASGDDADSGDEGRTPEHLSPGMSTGLGTFTTMDTLSEASDQCATCVICLSPFEEGEPVRVLVCDHQFHKECIDRWVVSMQLAADCPLCKRHLMDEFLG